MAFSSSPPIFANERAPGAGVTAVLGPTNTGKTHLAIERMLAHSSGVIGLPLRLLAREVYNKIVDRAGVDSVALITGEEKIKPPKARFWVSTVEAMPRDLDVSFLAVDEIQIAADLERGHVFTDRILHRRGRDETLLLGAATMRPIIERLLPGASIVTRPRLSQLEFAGDRKISRQPRRTAIVAFSADEVYAIAELIKRQHGGAARLPGDLAVAGEFQRREPRPCDDGSARQQPLDDRAHGGRTQQKRLVAAAPVQNAVGEDMPALQISGDLDFVDREERDVDIPGHRLHGRHPEPRIFRLDFFLAGDQRDGIHARAGGDLVVDLARQQPQRQPDRA